VTATIDGAAPGCVPGYGGSVKLCVYDRELERLAKLSELVEAAAESIDQSVEWVHYYEDAEVPDAMILGLDGVGRDLPFHWDNVPGAVVIVPGAPIPLGLTYERRLTFFDFGRASDDEIIASLALWLRKAIDSADFFDRELLELLIGDLRQVLDHQEFPHENPEDIAQVWASVETMEIQLRAPRPAKSVLRWAASQIPGFIIGVLSSVANDALTHFVHL